MASATERIRTAEGLAKTASRSGAHPDDVGRAVAATQLALAQSNIELAAALTRITDSATKPTGDIRKKLIELLKHLESIAAKA